jgi:hypothetical protein
MDFVERNLKLIVTYNAVYVLYKYKKGSTWLAAFFFFFFFFLLRGVLCCCYYFVPRRNIGDGFHTQAVPTYRPTNC